jgi:hypothetical protein
MAKKKPGTKILDDNGTLITASARLRGAEAQGADEGEAEADRRGIPKPS